MENQMEFEGLYAEQTTLGYADRKKANNQKYYQKNRERLLKKAKEKKLKAKRKDFLNVIPLFEKGGGPLFPLEKQWQRLKEGWWIDLLILILVSSMTFFLVSEAAAFYQSVEGSVFSAYLKAGILEGAVLMFTLLRPKGAGLKLAYRGMIVMIYLFSIWVVSETAIHASMQKNKEVQLNQAQIHEIEESILSAQKLRDRYFSVNRLTKSANQDLVIQQMKNKLESLRHTHVNLPDSWITWNTLATLVAFRVLVMLSNLFCCRELCRRLKPKLGFG